MRHAWMIAIAGALVGCSGSVETVRTDDLGYTTGGDGKPVGPSRVARPLEPAGPRANYPAPEDTFDIATEQADPMMENGPMAAVGCPAEIENVRIDVTDVYDGAAIIVTGDNAGAVAIQASARAMAAEQIAEAEEAVAAAPAPSGTEPAEGMGKPDDIAMPAVRTEVVDLAQGARISYFAEDPDDVVEVRNAVRRLASAMESGTCPPL